jgi:serine/threonine protein kinase
MIVNDPIDEIVSRWPHDVPFDTHVAIRKWCGPPLTSSQIACLALIEYLDSQNTSEESLEEFIGRFSYCRDELIHRIGKLKGGEKYYFTKINDTLCGQEVIRYLSITEDTQVYLTNDHALGGRVNVLKYSRRKSAESRMLAKLSHPSVVTLFSAVLSERPGEHGLILEYCGESVSFPSLPVDTQFDKLAELALGVEYVHSQGMIHNDLTPRNVIITRHRVKIIDFNAAVDTGEHGASRPIGTPAYLTQQSLKELLTCSKFISSCDEAIDYFSFVVLCYKLLTGSLPWAENAQPDAEGIQGVLTARQTLQPHDLDNAVLTTGQRDLFFSLFQERVPSPSPARFVRELRDASEARQRRSSQRARSIAAIAVIACVLAYLSSGQLRRERTLDAGDGLTSVSLDIREEIMMPYLRNDVDATFIACTGSAPTLSPAEKAIFAYAMGLSRADSAAQITYAESVIRSGCADAAVYSNLACAQLLRADVNEAFDALDKARTIDPSLPQPVFLRALALSKMKKFSPVDALTAISAALRLLPREVVVQRLAVEVLVRCERSDARSVDLNRLINEVRDQLSAVEHAPHEKTFVLYARPYISRFTSPDHGVSAPSVRLGAKANSPVQ